MSSPARSTLTASSWRSRGTRTDQPLSRKWRLSSPRIVGTAKEEKAVRAVRVEAVDRLQEPERGDLDEVVERLAGAVVAPRELARERQEALGERLAGRLVAVSVIALQQAAVLLAAQPARSSAARAPRCGRRRAATRR